MAIENTYLLGKNITLGCGFDLQAKAPLDSRQVVPAFAGLQALITENAAYEGMIVYDEETKKTYQAQIVDGTLAFREFGINEAELKDLIASETTAAMEFKGATATLPTTAAKGDFYKATAAIEVSAEADAEGNGFTANVGDSVVYDGAKWFLIPSGDDIEDTWRPVTDVDNDAALTFVAGDKLGVAVASNGTVTYSHEAIETQDLGTETETRTYVSEIITDGYGHITGYKTATENVEDTNTEYTFTGQVETSSVYFQVDDNKEGSDPQTVYVDAYSKNETDKAINDAVKVVADDLGVVKAKPAMSITEAQIGNWDGEVGAKTLAQGVKDVVDTNKETWDKAGTALQAADLAAYAKSADVTAEIGTAVAPKLDITTYEAYIAGKELSDAELKKYADDKAATAQSAAETTAANALDAYKEEMTNALAGKEAAGAAAQALADAKAYADGLDHEDTTYTVAPTANALEFTVTPTGKGEAQTVKLVAPVVDTGVMSVTAGASNEVITVSTEAGVVTVSHKDYETGTVKDVAHDSATDPSFITGIAIENGHVTGATVRNLAEVLGAMEFILDCGSAE
jgi:hypothetical protein